VSPCSGVDGTGALLALLLSPNPHQGLQGAALSLLLTPPLLNGVTAASTRAVSFADDPSQVCVCSMIKSFPHAKFVYHKKAFPQMNIKVSFLKKYVYSLALP
jgi:hypothetical protein